MIQFNGLNKRLVYSPLQSYSSYQKSFHLSLQDSEESEDIDPSEEPDPPQTRMSTRRSTRLSGKRPKKHPQKRSKIEPQAPDSENEIGITSEPSEDSEEFMPEKIVRTRKTEWHCRFEDCIRSIRPFNKRKNRNDHEKWFFEFIFGSN